MIDKTIGMSSIYDSVYPGLVEFAKQYRSALSSLNLQAISLMQSDSIIKTIRQLDISSRQYLSDLSKATAGISETLRIISSRFDTPFHGFDEAILAIAEQYKEMISSYERSTLTENMRFVLEQSQLATIAQLCLSNETTMIHDALGCFANAQYEYLPDIINQTMARPVMAASDVAFIKTGRIIPAIESKLEYPRGFKSSLESLNKSTAEDLSDNTDIEYDTKSNTFISDNSQINSKGLNIVYAGITVLNSEDIFTEKELIDFISVLSRTPMGAGLTETGKKIHDWIMELYQKKTLTMSFDKSVYYHCRSRQAELMPYTFDEMLKAPYGVPGAGRFNQVGRANFYFADTQNGAEAEVKKHLKKDEVLQTVMLKPMKEIKLLDLSQSLQRGATFLKMIRFQTKDEKNQMPKEYLLPCYVADCCRMIGFEGIKYYGSKEYNNYVSWSDGYFEDGGMC